MEQESGRVPDYDDYDDYEELHPDAEWCDRCQGMGTANCYCGGDQCYCENYGEMECPQCDGQGHFVPTEAFKLAREQNAKWWREYWEKNARDTDASASALKSPPLQTEGEPDEAIS